jgi:predicted transcriptional regulator
MNYFHKTVYEEEDGKKVIYTSIVDVQLFLSLLENYRLSISENLSPKATDILKLLVELNTPQPNDDGQPTLTANRLWTITEFMEETHIDIEKRSLQTYFSELNKKGFIRIVETKGRANVYELTENFNPILKKEKLNLTPEIKELIAYEYGDERLLDILKEDKPIPDLNIMDHDESIQLPSW